MNSPNTSSDTAPEEKLIIFETEETPESVLDESIPDASFATDLDNLPEGTKTSKFPKDLPRRMTSKHEQRSFSQHNHAIVSIDDIQNSPRPRWFLNHRSMKPEDLARLTTEFSQRTLGQLIPLQRRAWDVFKNNDSSNLESGETSDRDMLRHWGWIFNDFFFFGSMKRFMTVGIGEMKKVCGGRCTEEAYTSGQAPGSHDLEHTQCHIQIQRSTEPDRKIRLTQYLGCLLHQMVHAYIALFACGASACRSSVEQRGGQQHGFAFQDIAFGVEKGAEIFGLKLDLMRETTFAFELTPQIFLTTSSITERLEQWEFDEKRLRKQRNAIRSWGGWRKTPECYGFSLYQETLFS